MTKSFFLKLNKWFSDEFKYVLKLFLASRLVLYFIAFCSNVLIFKNGVFADLTGWLTHNVYNVWCQWDCGWYNIIVKDWYSAKLYNGNQATYGFFPLYPTLMKYVGMIFGDPNLGGFIVSNVFLFVAAIFLYKLVFQAENNKEMAKRAVKYFFVFPTAFIFSGALTESLFLGLVIMSFYYAQNKKWLFVGVCGFFAALTKHIGVLIALPLAFEYLRTVNYKISNIRWNSLWLLLIPMGTAVFSVYCFFLTGDFMAYATIQKTGWGHILTNPISIIIECLSSNNIYYYSHAILVIVGLLFLLFNYKKIRLSWWLYGFIFAIVPLMSGLKTVFGLLRYELVVFPFFIILAKITENKRELDELLVISLALLQGFLMVFWSTGSLMVV